MSELPPALQDAIDSIADIPSVSSPSHTVGALSGLSSWWRPRSMDRSVAPAWIDLPANIGDPLVDGIAAARTATTDGASILIPMVTLDGPRDDRAARSIIAVLTSKEASTVVGQPPGRTDAEWMQQCADVRDLSARLESQRGEPLDLLRTAGSIRVSFAVGLLLSAPAQSTSVLLDGTGALAAALVADRIAHRAKSWWAWASTSTDPACAVAADRMMLDPLLDLMTDEDGAGAQAALALLQM